MCRFCSLPSGIRPIVAAELDNRAGDALIEAVRRVAREEILPRFRDLRLGEIDTKTGPDDFVTISDRRAEAALRREVAQILPGAAFVGEEVVSEDPAVLDGLMAEMTVVVDPVDGTANFVRGLALFGVILAVLQRGRPVFGLLYDPVPDDWVVARAGGGAFLDRPGSAPRRLEARCGIEMARMAGFVHKRYFPEDSRARIAAAEPRFDRHETLRCSCHEYRMLALGRGDLILSAQSKTWDHAAGILALVESGGFASFLSGSPYDTGVQDAPLLAAADPEAHEALRGLFAAAA